MLKIRVKMFIKEIKKNLKVYCGLPHLKLLIIIVALSILTLCISSFYHGKDEYLSSIFANIFAGLVTGIVLSLFSTVKAFSLYKTEALIDWLNNLHNDYMNYNKMSRKILFYNEDEFLTEEELYNYIYDVLCCGNDINVTISQGRFDQSLPFNSYKYLKKHFNYDAVEQESINNELREKILILDVAKLSAKEIRGIFANMNDSLFELNGSILKEIENLKIKRKAINTFWM